MSAFSTALGSLFSDANFAVDVTYRRGGNAAPVVIKAIPSRRDVDMRFGETSIRGKTTRLMVRYEDLPTLETGDTFQVGATVFVVYDAPELDTSRLSWTVDLELAE